MKVKFSLILSAILTFSLFYFLSVRTQAAPGDLDPAFGIGGKVLTQSSYNDKVYALATQPDGKIVVAGKVSDGYSGGIGLTRYEP